MPETTRMSYGDAVALALDHVMDAIPQAIYFGEDVAIPGGVFGITKRLRRKFGERIFDTPISETAMLGAGIGAALMGIRPIVEIMWLDFTLVAVDQIINQAANVRYISNGKMHAPLTIRTQMGATPGSCAQHSQNLEALYTHVPGLVVGVPATPQDAYSMLVAAVYADDPVMVIENRSLYRTLEGDVKSGEMPEPCRGALIARPGTDLTIVTWGAMLHKALEAAEYLADEGVQPEVINARWLLPFDLETTLASVSKTGRLLIVHEANRTGGFGAEIAAQVGEHTFEELLAPIKRLATNDCRIPASPHLQRALIPSVESIVSAARELVCWEVSKV
jgi:acetoin:2,6-dichlorophenolindophenol oxidoreductase subunit beta